MDLLKRIDSNYKYVIAVTTLLISLWIVNVGGIFALQSKGVVYENIFLTFLFSLINNAFFAVIIGFFFFPLYGILKRKSETLAIRVLGIIFLVILIVEVSLIKYNLITLIYLGGDLLGYSLADISKTASASNDYSLTFLWPFLVLPVLLLLTYQVLHKAFKIKNGLPIFMFFLVIATGIKLTVNQVTARENQNKFSFLITDIYRVLQEQNVSLTFDVEKNKAYPLLQSIDDTQDVLSPFFNENPEPPNIVILIIEGLGRNFTGSDAEYIGFTPFLDSLQQKSLYWKNAVSTTGRTFGVIPSILGSLPMGNEGFLEIKDTPSHLSLITALKELNYTSSFYTGSDSSFDRVINFFEYQGTDFIVDQKYFGDDYEKTDNNQEGFNWGYADGELYKKALSVLDEHPKPRLDVYLTVTNHEPFNFPGQKLFLKKVEHIAATKNFSSYQKTVIQKSPEIFASLLYTDQSLKNFFKSYQQRADFKNTIFIITGDHRLIPIPQKDNLSRFHVPLIIYSPLLKKTKTFESIVSHSDIAPSLIAFLHQKYRFEFLKETAWLSQGLDTLATFRGTKEIPLMRYKGAINDFIYKDYFFTDNILFKINQHFDLQKVSDAQKEQEVKNAFQRNKSLNQYLVTSNKIYPDSLRTFKIQKVNFTQKQQNFINNIIKDKDPDEQFMAARELAFNAKREEARLICNFILNEYPNHSDARILKGRTLAWDGKYDEAALELLKVIKKNPYYDDAYLALLDVYWWSEQEELSLKLLKKDVLSNMTNPEISFKLAKANFRKNNTRRAKTILDSIIKIYPKNQDFINYRESIK